MPDWQFSLLGLVDLQPNPNMWPSGFSQKKRASPRTIVERNAKSTSPTMLEQFDRMTFLPKFSKTWDPHLNQTLGFFFCADLICWKSLQQILVVFPGSWKHLPSRIQLCQESRWEYFFRGKLWENSQVASGFPHLGGSTNFSSNLSGSWVKHPKNRWFTNPNLFRPLSLSFLSFLLFPS